MSDDARVHHSPETLEQCREVLATGVALGLGIPAIPGMTVYRANVDDRSEQEDWDLGYYPDEDSAKRALALWVVSDWSEGWRMAPWAKAGDDPQGPSNWPLSPEENDVAAMEEWLSTHTLDDIIATYMEDYEVHLSVLPVTILPSFPTPTSPITAADLSPATPL